MFSCERPGLADGLSPGCPELADGLIFAGGAACVWAAVPAISQLLSFAALKH